jgi:hypothetical protein
MIVTTEDLIKRAQLAADMHDGPFTPTQWLYWATQENIRLSLFLARAGWTANVKTTTITVTGSEAGAFTLAVSPLAIVAVHQIGTDTSVRRLKYNNAVDFLRQTVAGTATKGDPSEFRVLWDQDNDAYVLNFYPQPEAGKQFLVSYIPHPLKLVVGSPAAGEANSVKYPLGFEEWIVLKMAIQAKDAEESDSRPLHLRFDRCAAHIEQAVWDAVFAGARIRNVDDVERGYPPPTEWWFAA